MYIVYFLIIGNMNITHMFIWNLIYGYSAIKYFSHSCDHDCHSFWFNGPCFLNFNYFLEEKKVWIIISTQPFHWNIRNPSESQCEKHCEEINRLECKVLWSSPRCLYLTLLSREMFLLQVSCFCHALTSHQDISLTSRPRWQFKHH